mmetsp:Transcript_15908/g.48287  ORF Transcript_15908/g.48287 Transcript_15908/m.48287 type:complete len:205 (+) Transcript_15908:1015-1629(+)|eukprot:scaffold8700_cov31-Tisochrysis_lutea.AAC.12
MGRGIHPENNWRVYIRSWGGCSLAGLGRIQIDGTGDRFGIGCRLGLQYLRAEDWEGPTSQVFPTEVVGLMKANDVLTARSAGMLRYFCARFKSFMRSSNCACRVWSARLIGLPPLNIVYTLCLDVHINPHCRARPSAYPIGFASAQSTLHSQVQLSLHPGLCGGAPFQRVRQIPKLLLHSCHRCAEFFFTVFTRQDRGIRPTTA